MGLSDQGIFSSWDPFLSDDCTLCQMTKTRSERAGGGSKNGLENYSNIWWKTNTWTVTTYSVHELPSQLTEQNSSHAPCVRITLKPQRDVTSLQLEYFYQDDEGKRAGEAGEWWTLTHCWCKISKTAQKGLEREKETFSVLQTPPQGLYLKEAVSHHAIHSSQDEEWTHEYQDLTLKGGSRSRSIAQLGGPMLACKPGFHPQNHINCVLKRSIKLDFKSGI